MIDFERCDPMILAPVGAVIDALRTSCGIDSEGLLLVGAVCRNVLHMCLGHDFVVADTSDIDLGIALADWDAFDAIREKFPAIGDTGIRFRIAGSVVDVVPFGTIEDPSGIATPLGRSEPLVVYGFDGVYARASLVALPGRMSRVRIPTPAGYAALKMRAWLDRSPNGEYKDGRDLATALHWYFESALVADELYESDARRLEAADWDLEIAAARLLSRDMREQLGARAGELARGWRNSDHVLLSRYLRLPAGVSWTADLERRTALARELAAELD